MLFSTALWATRGSTNRRANFDRASLIRALEAIRTIDFNSAFQNCQSNVPSSPASTHCAGSWTNCNGYSGRWRRSWRRSRPRCWPKPSGASSERWPTAPLTGAGSRPASDRGDAQSAACDWAIGCHRLSPTHHVGANPGRQHPSAHFVRGHWHLVQCSRAVDGRFWYPVLGLGRVPASSDVTRAPGKANLAPPRFSGWGFPKQRYGQTQSHGREVETAKGPQKALPGGAI